MGCCSSNDSGKGERSSAQNDLRHNASVLIQNNFRYFLKKSSRKPPDVIKTAYKFAVFFNVDDIESLTSLLHKNVCMTSSDGMQYVGIECVRENLRRRIKSVGSRSFVVSVPYVIADPGSSSTFTTLSYRAKNKKIVCFGELLSFDDSGLIVSCKRVKEPFSMPPSVTAVPMTQRHNSEATFEHRTHAISITIFFLLVNIFICFVFLFSCALSIPEDLNNLMLSLLNQICSIFFVTYLGQRHSQVLAFVGFLSIEFLISTQITTEALNVIFKLSLFAELLVLMLSAYLTS